MVQRNRKQQAAAFGHRHILDRHGRSVVVRDRSNRRIAVGHQGISGCQVNRERFRAFQHDVIKRADGKLLGFACRPRKIQGHVVIVVIFRRH